jgi:hypothetical protein
MHDIDVNMILGVKQKLSEMDEIHENFDYIDDTFG